MSTPGREDFEEFFAAVNHGHRPFSWQLRLLDGLCETGRWPDAICAPTGSGKSSAVDVHVFANALSALGQAPRVPRRLAVVVNRRGLVDSHAQHAARLRSALSAGDGICGAVAAALAPLSLRGAPLVLANLRGGLASDASWLDDPAGCCIVSATPDMLGSRLLFRGYGSTRYAWPREAGLLGMDSVLLLDESHLNRQLHWTASDVAFVNSRSAEHLGVPGLQVTAMTATPSSVGRLDVVISVDAEGLHDPRDEPLRIRLTRPKPVEYVPTPAWPKSRGRVSDDYIATLARVARDVRSVAQPATGVAGTIGCFVNTVDVAVRLAERLAREVGDDAVACWVGRMRPMDLEEMRQQVPGLFEVRGEERITYLVATQTVEVGVDIDLAGLMTELASGSALAQRFGRVNRLGLRAECPVRVVGPEEVSADAAPYSREDLALAREWILRRQGAGGVAPVHLVADPAPVSALARLALSDLTIAHAHLFAQTSSELFAEPDLTFWLRDDLEADSEPVAFVVRADLPAADDGSAISLLDATPPDAAEAFPARIGVARVVVARILDASADTRTAPARCFRWRDRAIEQVTDPAQVRPGDVLIIDEGHPLTRRRVVVPDADVPERFPLGRGAGVVDVLARGRSAVGDALLDSLGEVPLEHAHEEFERVAPGLGLPLIGGAQVVIPTPDLETGELPWAAIIAGQSVPGDAEVRQEWTTRMAPVGLDAHQEAVARQAAFLTEQLGLASPLAEAVVDAALHHDDGKADHRFQRDVLQAPSGTLLAKSGGGAQWARRRRNRGSLPIGWRHEQMSAAIVWTESESRADPALVARLVGTSHGRGRPFFPHGAHPAVADRPGGGLLAGSEPAAVVRSAIELFATGAGWDDILADTGDRFGPWGCAYLEAVLRAADCTVSQGGS